MAQIRNPVEAMCPVGVWRMSLSHLQLQRGPLAKGQGVVRKSRTAAFTLLASCSHTNSKRGGNIQAQQLLGG